MKFIPIGLNCLQGNRMPNHTKEEMEKLEEKNSFLIQKSMYEDIKLMTEIETHFLLMAVFEYVISGVIPSLDRSDQRLVKSAFNRFKMAHDDNSTRYLKTCKKNQENINKRWKKKPKDEQLQHPIYG